MELLLNIMSFIDKADSCTLYSLCLTSTLLRSLCQRMLFSTFNSINKQARVLPFTAAITRNPQLASHVQNITISLDDGDMAYNRARTRLRSRDLRRVSYLVPAFRRAIAKIDPPEDLMKEWLEQIKILDASAFIPLILIQTPNLHRLSVTLSPDEIITLSPNNDEVHIWSEVGDLQRKREATYLPTQLKELEIKYDRDSEIPSFGQVENLYLPFIKNLDVCHLGSFFCDDPSATIKPGTLNISDLALQVDRPGDITVDFINGCTALRSFKYRLVESNYGYVLPGHLQRLLRPHAHTLEELTADFLTKYSGSEVEEYEEEIEADDRFYASFADFVRLKRMEVDGCFMHYLQRANLPPALEEYTVGTRGNFLRDISKLISSSRDMGFPPLKMNVIAFAQSPGPIHQRWEEDPDRECAALVERLRGTRISVKLVFTELGNKWPNHLVLADGVGYRRTSHGDISEDDVGDLLDLL